MTMRVVHVASGREWRGGQRQVWLLARGLARTGEVSQVVVTGRGGELARRLNADRIPVVTTAWDDAFDLRALLATVRTAARGSILHAHDGHALTLAGIASFLTGAHLVVTRRVEFPVRRRGFWRRAERIIAISEAVKTVLLTAGFPAEQIAVVSSGIALEETSRMTREDPRRKLGLLPSTPLAVATGALERPKDHATLIRAAALTLELADLHWAIAGEGRLRGDLERLIEELGLRRRVHLLGEVPDAARLVAAADVFVMSSIEEGLGTAVLDAMALGVPVVGTRAGGIPEMLAGGAGCLVPTGDPRALADAVLALLQDPVAREAQVARARKAVQRYGDERMAAGVLQVYRSLTSAH